jgi:hypothetical protein
MRCRGATGDGRSQRRYPGRKAHQIPDWHQSGDIIAEPEDIYGDGVNVAARLEALAEPGGICISRVVRDQIRDKLSYPFEDRGEQSVKNIARPVWVYELQPGAVADLPLSILPATASVLQTPAAPSLSIVVLPFMNFSNNPDQQCFADGITEDLTTDLSRLADILVISHSSAFTYKDRPVNARQIGRELGVRYVLEGSVSGQGRFEIDDQERCGGEIYDTFQCIIGTALFNEGTGCFCDGKEPCEYGEPAQHQALGLR